MRFRYLALIILVSLIQIIYPIRSALGATITQPFGNAGHAGWRAGQTFTMPVSESGILTSIQVFNLAFRGPNGRGTAAGAVYSDSNRGTLIGTSTNTISDNITDNDNFQGVDGTFNFSNLALTAGTQYYFEVYKTSGSGSFTYTTTDSVYGGYQFYLAENYQAPNGPYSGGVAFWDSTAYAQYDLKFVITYTAGSPTPSISSSPTISGTTTYGQTLTSSTGTWNNTPTSYTYQWSRASTSGGSYVNISGATSNTYVLVPADVGQYLKVAVTATNSGGSATDTSTATTVIAKANQTITFDTPTAKTYGDSAFTLSASDTTTSGLSITYTSATTGICTISTRTVTLVAAGTCTINANQAGNSNYNAATQVQQSFNINKATPTFATWGNVTKTYGDANYTVTAPTVTGSLAGAFTYTSDSTSVISISGSTFTIAGAGSATITASFTPTDTANYNNATTTNNVTVSKANQTLSFATTSYSKGFNETQLVSAAGTGTGAITYSAGASTACSVNSSSGLVTITASSGSCTITASIATDANYNSASSSNSVTFTVSQGSTSTNVTIAVGTLVFRQAKNISATSSVAGRLTFKANNVVIPGCKNLVANAGNSYTRTCSYKPSTRGYVTITVTLNPTNPSYTGSTTRSERYFVTNRSGGR